MFTIIDPWSWSHRLYLPPELKGIHHVCGPHRTLWWSGLTPPQMIKVVFIMTDFSWSSVKKRRTLWRSCRTMWFTGPVNPKCPRCQPCRRFDTSPDNQAGVRLRRVWTSFPGFGQRIWLRVFLLLGLTFCFACWKWCRGIVIRHRYDNQLSWKIKCKSSQVELIPFGGKVSSKCFWKGSWL